MIKPLPRPQRAADAAVIPYTRQHIDADDVAAVTEVLSSDWLTTGPQIAKFENAVAAYCGAGYAVALSNATAALHAALHALGVGPGDRVWTTPNSFVASANCASYCGATVDFVDIDPHTYNLSAARLEEKLAATDRAKLPKALVVVHFGGFPCEMERIASISRRHGIAIVEDAAHALGATYHGAPVSSGAFSDATIFCFHATKSIATGEGGMVVTNRDDVARSVRLFRSHGITADAKEMAERHPGEPWRYEQIELGFNYRMTDLQAALGSSQLSKLDAFVERRRSLAERYDAAFADLALQLPYKDTAAASAWHLYPIQLLGERRGARRTELYETLLAHGIKSQVHYIPIHTQPYYRAQGFKAGDFPAAEHY